MIIINKSMSGPEPDAPKDKQIFLIWNNSVYCSGDTVSLTAKFLISSTLRSWERSLTSESPNTFIIVTYLLITLYLVEISLSFVAVIVERAQTQDRQI